MTYTRPHTTLFAALSILALAGCGTASPTMANPPEATASKDQCVAPGAWLDSASGKTLSTPQAVQSLKSADVVLLGETHVVPDHHRWHMQTVAQLHAQRPDMILGFEAFPRRVQGVLDKWVAGELTQKEFLEQSEWETVWRYDANLYLPLFHFARMNHIPMVALNVDRKLMSQVSKDGWSAVPKADRYGIGDPAPAPQGYVELLDDVFGMHSNANGDKNGKPKSPGLSDPRFAAFVDVQVTWDRAMAEAAASALKAAQAQGRNPQLVGIIGRGHLDYNYGVPYQMADLGVTQIKVLAPWDRLRSCDELTHNATPAADLVYGLATTKDYVPNEADGPKLGVMIETSDGGVLIKDVVKDSIAQTTGLTAGDVIVEAAGKPMKNSADLISTIKAMAPGTWLPLRVQRDDKVQDFLARFPQTTIDAKQP